MARQLARRHRRERVAGVVIALLGVAVLIVAIIALRNPKQSSSAAGTATRTVIAPSASSTPRSASKSPSKSASPSTTKSTPASKSSSGSAKAVPLIVLNDTRTANLARDAAQRFESGGWKVTRFDEDYSNNILSTVVYYDPDVSGAEAAAQALREQYPTIQRVVPRFAQLPSGPLVVVLTSGYSPN